MLMGGSLRGGRRRASPLPGALRAAGPHLAVQVLGRLARLKAWRLAESRRQALPAYVILHDKTLRELALRSPGSLAALVFANPALGPDGKLVFAYTTYTAVLIAYVAINTPYGALMGVMSPSSEDRTSLNSYRLIPMVPPQTADTHESDIPRLGNPLNVDTA